VILFFVVLALNIVPAFTPPTWVTLSFVGLTVPSVNVVALAAVGATAAPSVASENTPAPLVH
jgi:hypothetical protein